MSAWIKADWTCGWLVPTPAFEDFGPGERECGAPVETLGDSAWRCEDGHEHLGIVVEWAIDGQVALAESICGREFDDNERGQLREQLLAR